MAIGIDQCFCNEQDFKDAKNAKDARCFVGIVEYERTPTCTMAMLASLALLNDAGGS